MLGMGSLDGVCEGANVWLGGGLENDGVRKGWAGCGVGVRWGVRRCH